MNNKEKPKEELSFEEWKRQLFTSLKDGTISRSDRLLLTVMMQRSKEKNKPNN